MKIKFVPQDCWIGLYWKRERHTWYEANKCNEWTTWYLCIIPCFPIIWKTLRKEETP